MCNYASKDKEYINMYNKYYREKKSFTPLIVGSRKYGEEYYQYNKENIKYYNYCKKNNIPYKKRGRPPHWRVEKNKECFQKVTCVRCRLIGQHLRKCR